MPAIPGFADAVAEVNGQSIAYSTGGDGPPLLLLHGFPQTRALWAGIAPRLAERYRVVAADLRGYGGSTKPAAPDAYSFLDMAADQVALMRHLGFDRFHVAGHDRGGRAAHRMALDHGDRLGSVQVMDIVPTRRLLEPLLQDVARAYYHWFFLAQPEPFPETMIGADPDRFFESCLTGWGAARVEDFAPEQLAAYRAAWRDPDTIRGMCNDYRATLSIDFELDGADADRRIPCPALVLYGADGAMARAYDVPETWSSRCTHMEARALPGGHFFPDTAPSETAEAMLDFLSRQAL
ncbi:MAG: alpha/beta fold hydrolase [Pseudooceanicola sp.]